jgi:hypothetical protein
MKGLVQPGNGRNDIGAAVGGAEDASVVSGVDEARSEGGGILNVNVVPANANNVAAVESGQVWLCQNALAATVGPPTGVTFQNITRNLPGTRAVLRRFPWNRSRQDGELTNPAGPIEFEIAPVDRKDPADLLPLRCANESGVREVHRQVAILPHQFTHARQVGGLERQNPHGFAFQETPERFLSF